MDSNSIWLFMFIKELPVQSAYVCAPSQTRACEIMQQLVPLPLAPNGEAQSTTDGAPDYLIQFAGMAPPDCEGILHLVQRRRVA